MKLKLRWTLRCLLAFGLVFLFLTAAGGKRIVRAEENTITAFDLSIRLPDEGPSGNDGISAAPAEVTVNAGSNFTVSAYWYDADGIAPLEFEKGSYYYAEIILQADDNYTFSKDIDPFLRELDVIEWELRNDDQMLYICTSDVVVCERYPVRLGKTLVNELNKDDILNDGTASFDPESNTLTLNGTTVKDRYIVYYQIFAENIDLTVEGSASLDDQYGGICVHGGSLTLNADINPSGAFQAVYADNDILITGGEISMNSRSWCLQAGGLLKITGGTVNVSGTSRGITGGNIFIDGGNVTVSSDDTGIYLDKGSLWVNRGVLSVSGKNYGICLAEGDLLIGNEVNTVSVEGADAISVGGELGLGDKMTVLEPETFNIVRNRIHDSEGNPVSYVIIGKDAMGWVRTRQGWKYRTETGSYVKSAWKKISERWYYFDADGYMQTGWKKISNKWYYFGTSGAMVTGWQKISDKWYYFSSGGAMMTGWQQISGKWYYFNTSGAMMTGWQKISDKWYYFNTSGAMVTGWQQISGKRYYFSSGGVMMTGWQKISDKWYYFESSGAMVTGWKTISGKTYYFKSGGVMAANEWCSGYWLNADGSWTYPYKASWKQNSTGWWYGDTSGWYARNCTITIDGKQYSFDAKGYWVK